MTKFVNDAISFWVVFKTMDLAVTVLAAVGTVTANIILEWWKNK